MQDVEFRNSKIVSIHKKRYCGAGRFKKGMVELLLEQGPNAPDFKFPDEREAEEKKQ
jgi:hypothetical protein